MNPKTLIIIKPGKVIRNNLVGEVINILEKKGLKIAGMKMVKLNVKQAEKFYQEHSQREFFSSLINFMCSSPIAVICLKTDHHDLIKLTRNIIGNTNPREALEGTIRKEYGEDIEQNAIHGSDSEQSAAREIDFFFKKDELF